MPHHKLLQGLSLLGMEGRTVCQFYCVFIDSLPPPWLGHRELSFLGQGPLGVPPLLLLPCRHDGRDGNIRTLPKRVAGDVHYDAKVPRRRGCRRTSKSRSAPNESSTRAREKLQLVKMAAASLGKLGSGVRDLALAGRGGTSRCDAVTGAGTRINGLSPESPCKPPWDQRAAQSENGGGRCDCSRGEELAFELSSSA